MTPPAELLNELQDATDALLMGHIAVGEPEAVRLVIARYERPLLRLLRRATGSSASVDDLFQETWIRVVRSANSYDPHQPFPAWLFAIAWNRVRDHWSRRKPDTGDATDLTLLPAPGASAEEQLMQKSEAQQMRRAVASLPTALAEALLLRYFEDLSEREISQRLGVPQGTVKSRLHYGLRKLATVWNGSFS
jgi:RNA polymerase sigma-70 factor (ECF subfamily)